MAASLSQLNVPDWFTGAAEELTPKRKKWARAWPAIALRDGREITRPADDWIVAALINTEAEAARHDLVDLMKRYAAPATLDAWIAAVMESWIEGEALPREAWVLTGAGEFGGAKTILLLQDLTRRWSRDKKNPLALRALDILGRIGGAAALQQITTLATGMRGVIGSEAKVLLGAKAGAAGTSREELEDRHVSDHGLDARGARTFNFGPRQFRAVLRPDATLQLLGPDEGPRRALPPIAASDDRALAQAAAAQWSEMRTGLKRTISAQARRLEQAMITGRRWSWDGFESFILRHPVMWRLAAMLIWEGGEGNRRLRLTEDRTFADMHDEPVPPDQVTSLRVAHRLSVSEEEWEEWTTRLCEYRLVQPFPQINREVYRCVEAQRPLARLEAAPHTAIKAPVLYGILENDGWQLTRSANEAGFYRSSWKTFVADQVTAVIYYSGFSGAQMAASPDQTISHATFHLSSPHVTSIPLGQVPPMAFSETVRRLLRLTSLGPP